MKSGKQRKTEIKARRATRASKQAHAARTVRPPFAPVGTVPVNPELLAPVNSYGAPDYVTRGFYVDKPFTCADCGAEEVWRATQQKWWYEVAKGFVYSSAKLCRPCRRRERDRRAAARTVHLEGVARKQAERAKRSGDG